MTRGDLLRMVALAVTGIAYVVLSTILVIALVSGWPAVLHGRDIIEVRTTFV
jgi:hypothetical protein